jgi:hypothetical protein
MSPAFGAWPVTLPVTITQSQRPNVNYANDGFGILEEGSHYPQITQITPIPSIVLCNRCNLWMNYRFCV